MSTPNKQVDEFIKAKILPEYRPIAEAFRKLIRKDFPELTEEMRGGTEAYYGTPVYRLHHLIMTISPTKEGITFAFTEGKAFEDKYRMLEGVGNKSLNIRLSSLQEFDSEKMSYYIRQAVDHDRKA